jgi:hypothetical protein
MRRLVLLTVVALGLSPGTWVRTPNAASTDERPILSITPLSLPPIEMARRDLQVAGAWVLSSANRHFGGYSALAALPDGSLLAVSDRGRRLRFTPPGRPGHEPRFDYLGAVRPGAKASVDSEGVTYDPASGRLWVAYENRNMIVRYDARFRREAAARPAAMRDWPSNAGPETIVRLADGRFVVLAEGSPRWFAADSPALLFPSDPADGAVPERFRFEPPDGYRPVDAAPLPDGRVLILLRRVHWTLPPFFTGKLMIADPAAIRPGERWRGELVADLARPLPTDNYEGLAIEPGRHGGATVWLISDDNTSAFQRTLLLKLTWRPNAKTRRVSRASS